jgi:hypothetical protein
MDYAKLLSQGVGSWLQFEHACGRSGLFSEKYLCHPIGQVLSARATDRTLAEYQHPVLAPLAKGPGRKPTLDFVVCKNYPKVSIAVESKWIGKTEIDVESILWDLIRLELVAHNDNARCFFVLGGTRAKLDALFATEPFCEATPSPNQNAVLRHDTNALHNTRLVPTSRVRTPMLKTLLAKYQSFPFPHAIGTRRTAPFPADQAPKSFQVYTWEVSAIPGRNEFFPVNSFQLRQMGATKLL